MLVVARIVLMTLLNQLAWFPPSGAPPPYAESWLEACLSVTPATRREGSAPGHGIMVPGRACSALQFSDFCCPGRQTGCLRALGHPIFRGLTYNLNSKNDFQLQRHHLQSKQVDLDATYHAYLFSCLMRHHCCCF